MTALSEALVAAQRRAIAALERQYVAGTLHSEALTEALDLIGATDKLDQGYLVAALHLMREYGIEAQANGDAPQAAKPMSDAQRKFIERLADERGVVAPDLSGLTVERASKLITDLQRGTYDANEWEIQF